MALKLKTPQSTSGLPALQRKGLLKGNAVRMPHSEHDEVKARNMEARMRVVMVCYSLWVGFWFQFVMSVPYNMPAIYTLSRGCWYAPEIWFYLKTPGSFPFSIAGNFLFYSCIGSTVALVFGWLFTMGVSGKWRLRFVIILFIVIILGWSFSAFKAEEAAWNQGLAGKITEARLLMRVATEQGAEESELRHYRKAVEDLEALEEQNPY